MNINAQIELLKSKDAQLAYDVLKQLLVVSDESSALYPYFDQFVEMINNQDNSYIRGRGLRLIAYNSKWDTENKVNLIIDQWLEHIEDDKPIISRQCIKDTVLIAKYKPELIDVLLVALKTTNRIYQDSMQSLIYKDRKKAIRQIRQVAWE